MFQRFGWVVLALALVALPTVVDAAGGSGGGGGGGGSTNTTARIVGYCTGIDYVNNRILIGQLYYGSGAFAVDSNTKVTINQNNATFADVQLNDYCEVRYDYVTRTATKIAVTR